MQLRVAYAAAAIGVALFAPVALTSAARAAGDVQPEVGALALAAAGVGAALVAVSGERDLAPRRAIALDAAALVVSLVIFGALASAGGSTERLGAALVASLIVRMAPALRQVALGPARALRVFAVALLLYAPLAAWTAVASLPYGDQVHYLMAADRLRIPSIDATFDARLFEKLLGVPPTEADVATHVVLTERGPRTVQGYTLALLVAPGWLLFGRIGAHVTIAVIAALASAQIHRLLDETVPAGRAATWLMATLLPPLLPMATHVYPDALGAALSAATYRAAIGAGGAAGRFGALLGAALFLTPRNALAAVAIGLGARRSRVPLGRVAIGAGAVALAAMAVNALVYRSPLPYAGYVLGTGAAQELTGEPSLTFRYWVDLPALLFDRTFGIAGTASWTFIALLGVVLAIRRTDRAVLMGAAAFAISLVGLSSFRLWQGGYAPPNRYVLDVLPFVLPLVAVGVAASRSAVRRAAIALLMIPSALAGAVIAAAPERGLSTAFEDRVAVGVSSLIGFSPTGWLPSFLPVHPEWVRDAYASLAVALAIAAALVLAGARTSKATEHDRRSG